MNNNLFSHHIFLFPFQWEFVGKIMKFRTMEERTSLKDLAALFDPQKWVRKKYTIDSTLNYNEYNYYYQMVRDVLFDEGKEIEKSIITNLFYNIEPDNHFYEFGVCTDEERNIFKIYRLHIESIILHLYSTGVGVLSFHLNNRYEDQKTKEDILNINQAGRRIYPPFFPTDFNLIGGQGQYEYNQFGDALSLLKKKEMPSGFGLTAPMVEEDFSRYNHPENFSSNPFQLPFHFKSLFGEVPFTVDRNDRKSEKLKVFINPLLDDRMFVICWYGNTEICKELSRDTGLQREGIPILEFEQNDWWYKYIFNDQKFATCQNAEMKTELIRKHTYKRWTGYNTFYGINRYSFVCLTDTLQNLKLPPVNAAYLVNHMQTIYYKMAELCLVQRACVLRFSEEVARISAMNETKTLPDRVGNLYKQYIRFVNRVYFREVTAQDQGIELYSMMQEHMKIEQNVKDLDNEISELHQYANLLEDQARNKSLTVLSIIGSIFIIPTFLAGIYGMNIGYFNKDNLMNTWSFIPIIAGFVITPALVVRYILSENKRKHAWLLFLAAIFFLMALLVPYILT